MRIAVTGAKGTLGRRFVAFAREIGHEVEALERRESHFAYPKVSPDVVLHLSWGGSAGAARNDATLQLDNVNLTLEAQKIALFTGARFVGVGTVTEVEAQPLDFFEAPATLPSGNYLYGFAKSVARTMSYAAASSERAPWTWLQLSNVYVPGAMAGRYIHTLASKVACEEEWAIESSPDSSLAVLSLDDALNALLKACSPLLTGRVWGASSAIFEQRELAEGLASHFGTESKISFGPIVNSQHVEHNILGDDLEAKDRFLRTVASDVLTSMRQ